MRKIVVSISALCLAIAAAPAWSAGKDELWEITTTMKMQGMAMPVGKTKSCMARDGAYNPDADQKDKNCTTTDYKVSGNTVTWKMKCTGKDAMTGSGEMTRTADTMKGTMKMNAEGMDMVQVMEGRRIGTCDAVAQKKAADEAIADLQAVSAANTRQACVDLIRSTVESGGDGPMASMFQAKGQCASQKAGLCEQMRGRAGTYAGYAAYANKREQAKSYDKSWGWGITECGINLDQQRPGLCRRAVAEKNHRFVGGFCPNEAAQLNARECAGFGRDYTADMARPNAAMCRALRSRAADYHDADTKANAEADRARAAESARLAEQNRAKSEGAMDKLKKTFGF